MLRECAPNATDIYLIGDFSGWKPQKEYAFTWNGMFFNVTTKNDFNLVYDLKLRGDEELSEYSKLLNELLLVIEYTKISPSTDLITL